MRTKKLALAPTLIMIAVAVPVTYAFAHRGLSSSYYGTTGRRLEEDEDWWNEMRQYMEEHWNQLDEATEQETTDEEYKDWGTK
jgi:hypothetical protein